MDRTDKRFVSLLWLVVPAALAILVLCVTTGYTVYRRALERAYHVTSWDRDAFLHPHRNQDLKKR